MSNLSAIGKGIGIYTAANGDFLPADLGSLPRADVRSDAFLCPSWRREPVTWPLEPNAYREAVNRETDYIYGSRSLCTNMPADLLLAYELPANHGQEQVNFLLGDLHVSSCLRMEQFLAMVQKRNEYLARERGDRR